MCANYTPTRTDLQEHFGLRIPMKSIPPETFPGYLAPIIRLSDDGAQECEAVPACFGIVPHWADLILKF